MILNKFSSFSTLRFLRSFSLQLLALSLLCCNKSANINANKSFITVTHVANGVGPITVSMDGTPLYADPLGFGFTTGDSLNPYDTTVSRVTDMIIMQDSITLLSGNATFQQGVHYSMFIYYDTANPTSASLIVLQNNPIKRADTITNVRYMNFSPQSSWGIKLVNTRNRRILADTVNIGPSHFVGTQVNPSAYGFIPLRIGNYDVYAFTDSAKPAADSSNFKKLGPLKVDTLTNYNIYLQGFTGTDTGQNKFQMKSIPLR